MQHKMFVGILCALSFLASGKSAISQSLTQVSLPQQTMTREAFMQDGFAGSVALVAGREITSSDKAQQSDKLIPLQNGACYRVINDSRISSTGHLYFAINHRLSQPDFRNAFVAVQVLRFVPAQNSSSDVAVTRSGTKWVDLHSGRAIGHLQTDMLHISVDDFVSAHTLVGGTFDEPRIRKLFAHTVQKQVVFHGRLQKEALSKSKDFYSSLDPALASQWTGLATEYKVPDDKRYAVFMRNYLISFKFAAKADPSPLIFSTDKIGSEHILVRLSPSVGSGFGAVAQTFEFANNADCLFVQPSSGLFSQLLSRLTR